MRLCLLLTLIAVPPIFAGGFVGSKVSDGSRQWQLVTSRPTDLV